MRLVHMPAQRAAIVRLATALVRWCGDTGCKNV